MALTQMDYTGNGSSGGWDETGTDTMTSSGVTVTFQKKPAFVYGELLYSNNDNLPCQYLFINVDGEYAKNTTYALVTLRPDYNNYGKGSGASITYDGDKTIVFKQYQSADAGKTIKWWCMYAE